MGGETSKESKESGCGEKVMWGYKYFSRPHQIKIILTTTLSYTLAAHLIEWKGLQSSEAPTSHSTSGIMLLPMYN